MSCSPGLNGHVAAANRAKLAGILANKTWSEMYTKIHPPLQQRPAFSDLEVYFLVPARWRLENIFVAGPSSS
jgi:hypothetical protein